MRDPALTLLTDSLAEQAARRRGDRPAERRAARRRQVTTDLLLAAVALARHRKPVARLLLLAARTGLPCLLLLLCGCADAPPLKGSTLSMTALPGTYALSLTIGGPVLPEAGELLRQAGAEQAERLKCKTWSVDGLRAEEVGKVGKPESGEEKMETTTKITGWLRCEI